MNTLLKPNMLTKFYSMWFILPVPHSVTPYQTTSSTRTSSRRSRTVRRGTSQGPADAGAGGGHNGGGGDDDVRICGSDDDDVQIGSNGEDDRSGSGGVWIDHGGEVKNRSMLSDTTTMTLHDVVCQHLTPSCVM
jgi:hypothetical protein